MYYVSLAWSLVELGLWHDDTIVIAVDNDDVIVHLGLGLTLIIGTDSLSTELCFFSSHGQGCHWNIQWSNAFRNRSDKWDSKVFHAAFNYAIFFIHTMKYIWGRPDMLGIYNLCPHSQLMSSKWPKENMLTWQWLLNVLKHCQWLLLVNCSKVWPQQNM